MKLEQVSDYKKVSPRKKLEVLGNVLQDIKDNLAIYQIPKSACDALALILAGLLEAVEHWENPHTNTSEVQKECPFHELITKRIFVKTFGSETYDKPHTARFRWLNRKGEHGHWSIACRSMSQQEI
ncbi:hypothetical protein Barb6_02156 [Bacteroidales bacterium Barb6]|nr:hypothetical protein Barb6_02156 [Bacteroidales bacterium Barb6]